MTFNGKALWGLAAFVMLVAIATDRATFGIGLVIAAMVVVELLTWVGALGAGRGDRP
jgi:hypothetical protein